MLDGDPLYGKLDKNTNCRAGKSSQRIFGKQFASDGLGQAVMNRLLKAAGHKVIHV